MSIYKNVEVKDEAYLNNLMDDWTEDNVDHAVVHGSCVPYRVNENEFLEIPKLFTPRMKQWFQGLHRNVENAQNKIFDDIERAEALHWAEQAFPAEPERPHQEGPPIPPPDNEGGFDRPVVRWLHLRPGIQLRVRNEPMYIIDDLEGD